MASGDDPQPVETRPRRPLLWRIVRGVLAAYLLVLLAMTFIENRLVFPAPSPDRANWSPRHLAYEDVEFPSEDGTLLHGWLFPRPDAARAVLYFHGNGEMVADNGDLMAYLGKQLDAEVLIFDYRGYGKSAGKPHERGVIADGRAAQRWLAERTDRKPGDIVLIGRSIGGGVAVQCAAELGAQALVLQSTFTRMTDAAGVHYPWLPVRWLMKNRFDSIDRLREYRGPVMVSHGTNDFVVPFEQGRALYEAAPGEPKAFFEISGGGHMEGQPKEYYPALRSFLDSLSTEPSP